MIIEVENFITPDQCAYIRQTVDANSDLFVPGIANREGLSLLVNNHSQLSPLTAYLTELFARARSEYIEAAYNPEFATIATCYEFHRYSQGQACKQHTDGMFSFNGAAFSPIRYATVIIHLTTDDSQLVFPRQDKQISTQQGKLVVFPPYDTYPHYSTPASGTRDIIMTWFTYSGVVAIRE